MGIADVLGDTEMIKFIFRNLISNAIKFSENAVVEVTTRGALNGSWQLQVQDHGIGMSAHQLQKLFNWEDRYTNLGTNNEKGTGIGLLLVKDFVERHHGQLHISSTLNEGTQITLNFLGS